MPNTKLTAFEPIQAEIISLREENARLRKALELISFEPLSEDVEASPATCLDIVVSVAREALKVTS